MIQIKHKKLHQISVSYYNGIDKKINQRILDLENILNTIHGSNGTSTIKDYIPLTTRQWGGIKKILNGLPGVNITSQSDLSTWVMPSELIVNKAQVENIITYLKVSKNRKDIISALPATHESIISHHYTKMGINSTNVDVSKKVIAKILDYKLITKKIAYALTWGLNIRVCPYCNRIWIDTIKDKKGGILRPTLDHFYSQAKYPLLALSFYNLIPSCTNCNTSIKNTKDFKTSTHVHPYIEGFDSDAYFSFTFTKLKKDISHPENFTLTIAKGLKISTDKELRVFGDGLKNVGSVPTLKLDAIYQSHRDLLGELYVKTDEKSPFYLTSIKDFLILLGASREEFYRFHFHNFYEDEYMNLRPLSKFSKEIILERVPELR